MTKRPGAVTFVGIMMFIGAFGYLLGTIVDIYLWLQPEEAQTWYGARISDWYWIMNGLLNAILVVGFIWIGRLALRGDYAAGMTVNLLAIINLIFSFFNLFHGYGVITLLISVVVLVANNSKAAQDFYKRSLPASAG